MENKVLKLFLIFFYVQIYCTGIRDNLESSVELYVEPKATGSDESRMTIRCGFSHRVPDIKVIYMSLQASESCHDEPQHLNSLAHVDLWTQQPKLDLESAENATDVLGTIDHDDILLSYISVSLKGLFGSQGYQSVRCVVQAVSLKGQPMSAIKTFKDKSCLTPSINSQLNQSILMLEAMYGHIEDVNLKLSEQLENYNISENFQEYKTKLLDVGHGLEKSNIDITISTKNISHQLDALNLDVNNKLDLLYSMIDDYRRIDSLQCNRNEVIDVLDGFKDTVGNQFDEVFNAIKNTSDGILKHMNDTNNTIRHFSSHLAASDVTQEVKGLNDSLGLVDKNVKKLFEKLGDVQMDRNETNNEIGVLDTKVNRIIDEMGSLSYAVNGINNKMDTLNNTMKNLKEDMQEMEGKLEKIQNIDDALSDLPKTFWALQFANSLFTVPNASEVYKGHIYLFTKDRVRFNIDAANTVCQDNGGYLIELDDEDEFEFVNKLVMKRRGSGVYFFTGYTDRIREGMFLHINSERELLINKWRPNQPDNSDEDDCVEFYSDGSGLNDEDCDYESRYICEVPYPF